MQQASRQLNLLKTKLNQLIIKIGQITPDETLKFECYGWSADSQEDISVGAVVGILDRDRENWEHSFVTIKPSYDGASNTGHLWVESDDGNFTKADGMSAANYAYSYALVEAADKWKPHYGHATISSINGSNYTLSNGETGTATFRDCSALPYQVGDSVVYDSNFNIVGYQNQFAECLENLYLPDKFCAEDIYFGRSVALNSNYIVVSSPSYTANSIQRGRVYIYTRSTQKLLHIIENPLSLDSSRDWNFGLAVACSSSYFAVSTQNKVCVFSITSGNHISTIENPNGIDVADKFGFSIDIDPSHNIAIGAYSETHNGFSKAGRVYLFSTTGTLLATIDSDDITSDEKFGWSVSISSSYLAVGATGARHPSDGDYNSGIVYVYTNSGTYLGRYYNISRIFGSSNTVMGFSIATEADVLVVSTPYGGSAASNQVGKGAIYDLTSITTNAYPIHQISNPNTGSVVYDQFGYDCDISGDKIIFGAPGAEDGIYNSVGKAYIYNTSGSLLETINNPDEETDRTGDGFGYATRIDGGQVVIGSPFEEYDPGVGSGRSYVLSI